MDGIVEQIVSRKGGLKRKTVVVFVILTLVLVACMALYIAIYVTAFAALGFLVFGFSAYISWYIISIQKVDFEYDLISGDMSIDRIVANRKRKRLATFRVNRIEDFGDLKDLEIDLKTVSKVIKASITEYGEDVKYAIVHTDKYGRTLILFSPDERTMNAMKPFFKGEIFTKIFRNTKQ